METAKASLADLFPTQARPYPMERPVEEAGAAIDWRSKLQPTVALPTVEAEAMALCAATVEVEYTRGLLSELSG